ncbi:MAG: enoyl-CoA hydratase-related protein [Chitinophagales bacterium]
MENYQYILLQIEDYILTITINRPDKLNALNAQLLQEIKAALIAHRNDDAVKGVILTGSGKKAFAAGADISEFSSFNGEQAKKLSANGHSVMDYIEGYPKPVIAAVNGFALGGGCELTMACHMRIASDNARFGQPEVNLGLPPGYGGTQRLVQLIGKTKAMEYLLTADMIAAEIALQLGLVNYVVPQDELLEKCNSILQKIATKGPIAVAQTIDCVNAVADESRNGFEVEINAFGHCFDTEDFKEGTGAFLEKRKAEFIGK